MIRPKIGILADRTDVPSPPGAQGHRAWPAGAVAASGVSIVEPRHSLAGLA